MIGTKIAHYEIVQHLGSGGMGEVYVAEDSKLKRQVALKIIKAGLYDHSALLRFDVERQTLAGPVLDVDPGARSGGRDAMDEPGFEPLSIQPKRHPASKRLPEHSQYTVVRHGV
jgi:serine/threonine protein kinase